MTETMFFAAFLLVFAALTVAQVIAGRAYAKENHRFSRQYRAFQRAFVEWSKSCDWLGYREIPLEMYEDLVARLELAKLDAAGGADAGERRESKS